MTMEQKPPPIQSLSLLMILRSQSGATVGAHEEMKEPQSAILLQGNRPSHMLHCRCRLLFSPASTHPCVCCSGNKKSPPGSLHSCRVTLNRQAQPPDRITQHTVISVLVAVFMKSDSTIPPSPNAFLFLKSRHLRTSDFFISNTRVLRSPAI